MRARDIIGLILALLLAVSIALLTRLFLTKEEKPKQEVVKAEKITRILVAGKKLSPGDKIQPGDLVWQEWPSKALTPNDLTEEKTRMEDFIGSIVRFPISQGNPIVREELVKKGDKGFLAAVVAPGKRAVSIDVTASSADSGLIFPGDYVDVILSKTTSEGNQQAGISKTILKNIKVLAFDTTIAAPDTSPKTPPRVATLELTPPQAEVLLAGTKEGTIALSLHSMETQEAGTGAESVAQLPPEKHSRDKKIILMRGHEKSELQFQEKE